MKNTTLLAAVLSLTMISVLATAYQSEKGTHTQQSVTEKKLSQKQHKAITKRPQIELVFALDTTGSMSGLINAAKEKIWSIASTMASAQPAPDISIGLVAYRDRGDAYVTKRIELSTDLDAVYTQLLDLTAGGGGDGPESVNAALFDAVNKMNWSQNPNSYKVVFLVGDAPGHNDYQDDIPYTQTIARANQLGIIVNTIQAGQDSHMISAWKKIANLGQGDTFQVDQRGSAIAINTPFDEAIITASRNYENTRVYYGRAEEQLAQQKKMEVAESKMQSAASVASLARRAKYNTSKSGEKNFSAGKELLGALENEELALADIAEEDLPLALRKLSATEKEVFIKNKINERKVAKEKLQALNKKRDLYIKEALEKNKLADNSLDKKLYVTLKKQAESKGLSYADTEESY